MMVSDPVVPQGKVIGKKKKAPTLWIIILIKLGKGILLLSVALALYLLSGSDLPAEFNSLLLWLNVDPERAFFVSLAQSLDKVTPSNLLFVAGGTVIYSLFSVVEGFGLIFRVPWAGWMAIGESAFFIPIEVHELLRKPSLPVLGILALNVLIVVYLFRNRERLFKHH